MDDSTATLTIDRSHCGPPHSGNGGWVSGSLAEHVLAADVDGQAVTVRLSAPPPLDRPLRVEQQGPVTLLMDGTHQVASAAAAAVPELPLPAPASAAEAAEAETRYEGLADHPFPTCFSCGTEREPQDALCLRPGPLADGTERYAARWTPFDSSVPLVWAALDCPGGWSAGIAGRPMVLGSMTAVVHALPETGVEHVVTSWPLRSEGRKHFSGSMLHSPTGELLALATAIWIAVDPESVRPIDHPESHKRKDRS